MGDVPDVPEEAIRLDEQMARVWEAMEIGARFGPVSYEVTDAVVDAYRDAAELAHPWYRDGSPFGGRVCPPELPCTDYSTLTVDTGHQIGFHSRHRAEFSGPVLVGDELTATGTIAEKFQRRGFRYFSLDFEQATRSGAVVCRQTITSSVGVLRDPAYRPEPRDPAAPPPPSPPPPPELPVLATRTMTQDAMNRFAAQAGVRWGEVGGGGAHTDEDYARRAGLAGTNAQSLHYVAWLSDALLDLLGERWLTGGGFDLRFMAQVAAGDVVTIAAGSVPDHDPAQWAVRLTKPDGALVSAGTVRVPDA